MPVHHHAVAAGDPQLGVEGLAATVVFHGRAHDRGLAPVPDQGLVGDVSERPAQGDPGAASSSVVFPAPLRPSITVTPGPSSSPAVS